jgi:hypothetical protein
MFLYSPMVAVRLPRSTEPLFTVRGPLTNDGDIDDEVLVSDIKREVGFDGKVSLSWLSEDLGIVSHNGSPTLTLRVD